MLEAEDYKCTIRLPANAMLHESIAGLLNPPVERPVAIYNQRGTAAEHIKQGKKASAEFPQLSCGGCEREGDR